MSEWISIKDRLPENGQGVLITDGDSMASASIKIEGDGSVWWNGHGFGGYEWEFDFHRKEITHWMPLPKLPTVAP